MSALRPGNGGHSPFPASIPPQLNHAVLSGKLSAEPQATRNPNGAPVTLLQVEFPVADPDYPQGLWTWASCLVEVPRGRGAADLPRLHGGTPVLAAGQLSDRWVIEGGHTSKRGVIVATLIKAGHSPAVLIAGDKS